MLLTGRVLYFAQITHSPLQKQRVKICFQVKYFQFWRFLQRSHLKKIPFPLLINYKESNMKKNRNFLVMGETHEPFRNKKYKYWSNAWI
jgi:hypothetical protein